jgi:hypothetical protein
MDVSELRKRILRSLDEARKDAVARREVTDRASRAYETFLNDIAVPLVRQAAQVLNAAGETFSVHTPVAAVRLVSDKSPQTFLEVELDPSGTRTDVIGRVSVTRGRQGAIIEERPIAPGKAVEALTEQDLSAFLVAEIPRLVVRP